MLLRGVLLLSALVGAFACLGESDCGLNEVCVSGSCRGLVGATCSGSTCADGYSCINTICRSARADNYNSPTIINTCSSAPTTSCNSAFSISLRENNLLSAALTCKNPSQTYPSGTPVAMFYMPTTTLLRDTLNVTFYATSSQLTIRVLTPCSSGACDRALEAIQVGTNRYAYNHYYDYNSAVSRGYIIIAPSQFPAPSGYIVNVTAQCLKPAYLEGPEYNIITPPVSCQDHGINTEIYENYCVGACWSYPPNIINAVRTNVCGCHYTEVHSECHPGVNTYGLPCPDGWVKISNICYPQCNEGERADSCACHIRFYFDTECSSFGPQLIGSCRSDSELYNNFCRIKCPVGTTRVGDDRCQVN